MRRAAAIGLVITLLAACGDDAPATLDAAEVEGEIADALEDLDVEADVSCPPDVELDEGDDFECEVEPDEGDSFDVEVLQSDDEGNVEFVLPIVKLVRSEVEEVIGERLSDEQGAAFTADCSAGFPGDEAILEDGDDFDCTLTSDSGAGGTARVSIDVEEDGGFTFRATVGVVPTTTTSTIPVTTTTVPATVVPTLPPATLPPVTDDTTPISDDTLDTTVITEPDSITVLFDPFDDNANGWLLVDTPGLATEIDEIGVYEWFVDFEPELNPLPFEQIPEAILPVTGLEDVDVLVDVSFLKDGMAGVTCMSSPELGKYTFAVGFNRAYIGKVNEIGEHVELKSGPFSTDATFQSINVHVSCFPSEAGTQLSLSVGGDEILAFEDTTNILTTGAVGLWMDFDAQIPVDQRADAVFVWDNFEVRQF
jgi:hypothetical protein